jgi:hypothetical protein
MDGSHAFDFPLNDFLPTQHAALDAALTRETIAHEWHGTTLSVDVAYEARVTTLIDQARSQVLPYSPPVGTAATPTMPTAPRPPTGTAVGTTPGYPPGPGYGYGYVGYGQPRATTNGLAVASMILGIISLVLCGSLFTGVPAIICAIIGRRQIRDSGGTQQGDGMALAGLITGGIATALSLVVVAFYVVLFIILGTAATTT